MALFRVVASAAVVLLGAIAFLNIFWLEPQQTIHPDLRLAYGGLGGGQIAFFVGLAALWLALNLLFVRIGARVLAAAGKTAPEVARWDLANAATLILGLAAAGTMYTDFAVGFGMYSAVEAESWAPPGGSANALTLALWYGGLAVLAAAATSIATRTAVVRWRHRKAPAPG